MSKIYPLDVLKPEESPAPAPRIEVEATALPLVYVPQGLIPSIGELRDATGVIIAIGVTAQTAALIVQAVNSHQALVDALRECMKDSFTSSNGMSESGKRDAPGKRCAAAQEALRLAAGVK